jgi:Tfp pilus assembly protein PilV
MDIRKEKTNQAGVGVVEVIICLGIAAVIIFSISQALAATHRLDTASNVQEQALAYGKQAMEITTQIINTTFITDENVLNNDPSLSNTVPDAPFTREITIEQLCRDTLNNYISCNPPAIVPDGKTEKITTVIKWQGQEKVKFATIFTDWKNVSP